MFRGERNMHNMLNEQKGLVVSVQLVLLSIKATEHYNIMYCADIKASFEC